MKIQVASETHSSLEAYASVSIAFEVASVFDISGSVEVWELPQLAERSLDHPYTKDYDEVRGNNPLQWAQRFDVSEWQFLAAYVEGRRVGGAVVILRAPDVGMLEGRDDLALLWDFRVSPSHRSQGVGSALMSAAERLASDRGAREIKVETQNINVPACKFYKSQGFELRHANAHAYPDLPHEVQLLWYKSL